MGELLTVDPVRRITVEDALNSNWMQVGLDARHNAMAHSQQPQRSFAPDPFVPPAH